MNNKKYIIIRIIALALLSAITTAHGMTKPSLLTQQLAKLRQAKDAGKPVATAYATGGCSLTAPTAGTKTIECKTPVAITRPSHHAKPAEKPEVKHGPEEIKNDADDDNGKENSSLTKEEQIVFDAFEYLQHNPATKAKTLTCINSKRTKPYSLADLKCGSFCVYPDEEIIGITIGEIQFFINYEGDFLKINPGSKYFINSPVIDVYGVFDISHGKN